MVGRSRRVASYTDRVTSAANQRDQLLALCSHLRLDLDAESSDPALPGFMAPPPGSPPYYGFAVTDITADGFALGLISDPLDDDRAASQGDGFVVAPDGSRAGLVWKVDAPYAFRTVEDTDARWGVWLVGVSAPWTSRQAVEAAFPAIVADLKPHWEAWARR